MMRDIRRVVTETPPFWQIALSLALGFATVVTMVWLAARVYRTGMLMYGKRATIRGVASGYRFEVRLRFAYRTSDGTLSRRRSARTVERDPPRRNFITK